MNDRELVELAARAIELPESGWMGDLFMYVKDNRFTDWNPLEDNNDAFQLAVKAQLTIVVESDVVWAGGTFSTSKNAGEPLGRDPQAATRRAIVRAVAAIGSEMP